MNGYTNIGGSLNVTCSASGAWSPFPNCALNSGSGSLTMTTAPAGSVLSCLVSATTLNITNGYYSNMSLSYTSSNMATGNEISFPFLKILTVEV